MKSRNINIFLKILIILLILMMVNMPVVKAASLWDNVIDSAEAFYTLGKNGANADSPIQENEFKTMSSNIYNFLFALGVVLSVVIGVVLGIKIMWGGIEQQTKAKEALMPYAVGCVVIFGAFAIWKICIIVFGGL